ncbi:recombinase family protein [Streptomyces sp. NL15-2K]|uniref:recombinase family protein n=1 Tax=Streptomyces sp. NL15-2K TaxID=376149 RepID=UPI000FF9875D|nr:recombinase family protein [Streptomyces sp. NL15-2K]GCB45302.1 phage integrase [Streptomyces sp. NL15-2K]
MVTGMDIHAGVYGRQSSRRGNKSEISTEDQLKEGVSRARMMNAARIATYEDLGISAFSGEERPDFDRMIADCRTGRLNVIIVYYVSRFSRLEVADSLPVVMELLNMGVTIVSITEGTFKRDNIMDLIHLIFRLDAAHQESKNKSIAVKRAKATAKELGGWSGPAPYGFETYEEVVTRVGEDGKTRSLVIKKLRPNTEECTVVASHVFGPVVDYMDKPYDPGYMKFHPGSISGVTTNMNRLSIPTRGAKVGKERAGSQWDRKTVARILQDPRFIGFAAESVYDKEGKGRKVTGYRILRDEEGQPIRLWDPVIDPADFWRVQDWLQDRKGAKGNARGGSLLSGLGVGRCLCGATFGQTRFPPTKTYPEGQRAYRCTRGQGVTDVHKGAVVISMDALDDYVASRIFALIRAAEDDEEAALVLVEVTRRYARTQENPETAGERSAVLTERAELRQDLEELYDERDAGGFRTEVGRRRFLKSEAGLADRLETLDKRMAELEAAEDPKLPLHQWQAWAQDPVGEGSWWSRQTLEEKREFVKLWVKCITIKPLARTRVAEPIHQRVVIEWHKLTEELDLVA